MNNNTVFHDRHSEFHQITVRLVTIVVPTTGSSVISRARSCEFLVYVRLLETFPMTQFATAAEVSSYSLLITTTKQQQTQQYVYTI